MDAPIKVPVALGSDGRLYHIEDSPQGMDFQCPGCLMQVHPRRPSNRRPHFFHASLSHCSEETALHKAAKHWIAQLLRDAMTDISKRPTLWARCDTCDTAVSQLFDLRYSAVKVEQTLPSGLRPDVLLLQEQQPVAAIEIRNTHAVNHAKAFALDIPWVELDAIAVMNSPLAWYPTQRQWEYEVCFEYPRCTSCHRRIISVRSIVSRLSTMRKQTVIDIPYAIQTAPYRCHHCNKACLVYGWIRGESFESALSSAFGSSQADSMKLPATLVTLEDGRPEQQNSCPQCGMLIDDELLWNCTGGPFIGLERTLDGTIGDDPDDHLLSRIAFNMESSGKFRFPR